MEEGIVEGERESEHGCIVFGKVLQRGRRRLRSSHKPLTYVVPFLVNKESRWAEFNRWQHVSVKPAQAKFWGVAADSVALLTERIRDRVN